MYLTGNDRDSEGHLWHDGEVHVSSFKRDVPKQHVDNFFEVSNIFTIFIMYI